MAARAKGGEDFEAGLLLFGLATCLMWLRTLSFVLVQQDLGQALLLNTHAHARTHTCKRTGGVTEAGLPQECWASSTKQPPCGIAIPCPAG